MIRAGMILLITCLAVPPTSPQEWIEVSPESAAVHLIKKVEPTYPVFAKAAGIEGVVRIQVGIYQDGRIHSVAVESGPPCLHEAAKNAILQYVYRPFEENGRRTNVTTTLDVAFKLAAGEKPPPLPAPPVLTRERLYRSEHVVASVSPAVRKWLAGYLKDLQGHDECNDSAVLGALNDPKEPFPDQLEVFQARVRSADTRVYVVMFRLQCMCGATGNCAMTIVEEDSSGVRSFADAFGGGFYVYERPSSVYPAIFTASNSGGGRINIAGYIRAGEEWGQAYCGEIIQNDAGENVSIGVCH